MRNTEKTTECPLNLAEIFVGHNHELLISDDTSATPAFNSPLANTDAIPKDQLIKLQESDPDLVDIREKVESESEAAHNQVV